MQLKAVGRTVSRTYTFTPDPSKVKSYLPSRGRLGWSMRSRCQGALSCFCRIGACWVVIVVSGCKALTYLFPLRLLCCVAVSCVDAAKALEGEHHRQLLLVALVCTILWLHRRVHTHLPRKDYSEKGRKETHRGREAFEDAIVNVSAVCSIRLEGVAEVICCLGRAIWLELNDAAGRVIRVTHLLRNRR